MTKPRNAVQTNRGRIYKWGGEEFVSVTTVLSRGIPKPALTSWAAKSVAEFVAANLAQVHAICENDTAAAIDLMKGSPWRQRNAAADLGSRCHAAAEARALGVAGPDVADDVRPFMEQFERFLDDFQPTYDLAEASVYNRKWGFAGTLDAILVIEGAGRLLVDTKTGKDVYPEVGLQLAAYRNAEFIGLPDGTEAPMPAVDGCAALHLTATGYRLIPVRADDAMFRSFLYAQQVQQFIDGAAGDVIGAPLAPARQEVPA